MNEALHEVCIIDGELGLSTTDAQVRDVDARFLRPEDRDVARG